MNVRRSIAACTLLLIQSAGANEISLGALPDDVYRRIEGCSCTFNRVGSSAGSSLIGWALGPNRSEQQPHAFIQIGGDTRELPLLRQTGTKHGTTWTFGTRDLTAILACREVQTPASSYAESEGVVLRGKLLVRDGKLRSRAIPVEGACGC